jgi:hypothetical protein
MAHKAEKYTQKLKRAEQFRREGKTLLATKVLRDILDRDDGHYAANYMLGMLYHDEGRSIRGIHFLGKAVEARSDDFVAVLNLGIIQQEQGLLTEALANLKHAVSLKPENAHAQAMLGLLYRDLGKPGEAARAVEESLALDPDNADTLVIRGSLHQEEGELETATAYYKQVLSQSPLHGEACYRLSLLKRLGDDSDLVSKWAAAWNTQAIPVEDRILVGYALGRAMEQGRQFDRAFAYFREANELQQRFRGGSTESQAAFFNRHKQGINTTFVEKCQDHALTDNTPVFIVGLPRSGTSLVEQILASHPAVHGSGEIEHSRIFVENVEQRTGKPFPLDIDRVDPKVLAESGREYIGKLRASTGTAERVTDKLPHNFLRIGLYAAIMPEASIVLCERDPLDNCLSIYQHFFTAAHGYASDLSALGRYYRLYRDLVGYWDRMLPGHIHHIRYEALVHDTENQVKLLLDHCGLEFHPDCLAFHQAARAFSTPSDAQVRQPIYQHAVGRWSQYEKHLSPLREALEM